MKIRDGRYYSTGVENDAEVSPRKPSPRQVIDQIWIGGITGISARGIAKSINCDPEETLVIIRQLCDEGSVMPIDKPDDSVADLDQFYVRS